MSSKKGLSKKVVFLIIAIVVVVVGIVIGAFYIKSLEPEVIQQETLSGGNVSLTYTDEENLFAIQSAIPTSDLVGVKYDSADKFFDFTVKIDIEEADYIEYEILLIKDEIVSTALDKNIKVYLEKEDSGTYVKVSDPLIFDSNINDEKLGESIMSVYKVKKKTSGNDNYRLRMWLADTAVFPVEQIQCFGVKVAIRGVAK